MTINKIFLFGFVFFILLSCSTTKQKEKDHPKQNIILKLDDLLFEDGMVHQGWIQAFDFLNEQKVVGTIGVIGHSLEEGNTDYFSWIKDRDKEGHEIWNHGFCHCRHIEDSKEIREYSGNDLDYQVESLQKTQKLAQEKLGMTFKSFGAPYNGTDQFTCQALAKIPDLQIWMFKETEYSTDKYLLNRISKVNIEFPVHNPNFEEFKLGYAQHKSEPILTLQGHPRSWVEDKRRFEDFKKIVLYLKNEGVTFTTPQEYASKQKQ